MCQLVTIVPSRLSNAAARTLKSRADRPIIAARSAEILDPNRQKEVHMSATERRCRWPGRWVTLAAGLLLVLLVAAACGADGEAAGSEAFQKITPSDSVYTIDDFAAVGFKKVKQYDVAELPAGVDAWQGYWGPDPYSRKDYELRFYGSHEDAVEHGPALAREVTGEDAEAYRKNPTWKEGAKDRWQNAFTGDPGSTMHGPFPKYGGYVIFGNVLVLCEGADSAQALERSKALVDALTTGETE